jgi:hypothetical protein
MVEGRCGRRCCTASCASGDEDGVDLALPKANKGVEEVHADEGERGE